MISPEASNEVGPGNGLTINIATLKIQPKPSAAGDFPTGLALHFRDDLVDGDYPVYLNVNGTPVTADSFLYLHDNIVDGAKIQVFGGSASNPVVSWKSLVCPCTLSRFWLAHAARLHLCHGRRRQRRWRRPAHIGGGPQCVEFELLTEGDAYLPGNDFYADIADPSAAFSFYVKDYLNASGARISEGV